MNKEIAARQEKRREAVLEVLAYSEPCSAQEVASGLRSGRFKHLWPGTWWGANADDAHRLLRQLEKQGKVTAEKVVRFGIRQNVWTRTR